MFWSQQHLKYPWTLYIPDSKGRFELELFFLLQENGLKFGEEMKTKINYARESIVTYGGGVGPKIA